MLIVIAFFGLVSVASAEVQGNDEQVYAIFLAALEKCQAAFPEGKADYDKVRRSLAQYVEINPKLSAAAKSPTLASSLAEARVEVNKYITNANKQEVCSELRDGRFGQFGIPLLPDPIAARAL
jgi:hypothetical protein